MPCSLANYLASALTTWRFAGVFLAISALFPSSKIPGSTSTAPRTSLTHYMASVKDSAFVTSYITITEFFPFISSRTLSLYRGSPEVSQSSNFTSFSLMTKSLDSNISSLCFFVGMLGFGISPLVKRLHSSVLPTRFEPTMTVLATKLLNSSWSANSPSELSSVVSSSWSFF